MPTSLSCSWKALRAFLGNTLKRHPGVQGACTAFFPPVKKGEKVEMKLDGDDTTVLVFKNNIPVGSFKGIFLFTSKKIKFVIY